MQLVTAVLLLTVLLLLRLVLALLVLLAGGDAVATLDLLEFVVAKP